MSKPVMDRPIFWARQRMSVPEWATKKEGDEFTSLQYTAVDVVKPYDFVRRFSLRVAQLAREGPRHTPLILIVVTMYNEGPEELEATLIGICKNVRSFCRADRDENAWQKILVCVVSDGRLKANTATLEYVEEMGCYNNTIVQKAVDHGVLEMLDIRCHLFERSVQLRDKVGKVYAPLQLVFALKEHNAGKLDSHRWFFNAFAESLNVRYTVLLDVGTVPQSRAIYKLFRAMERDPKIAGCCGEITVNKFSLNPIVAAQIFEYKISNLMDKALESVFGFVSVLPGAFSAYRFAAIRGEPLGEYFRTIERPPNSVLKGNMHLAEDRILCFALLAQENEQHTLHYVKNSVAMTDVPETLPALIAQRRRWNNGAFFAMCYSISHFGKFLRCSKHSVIRKLAMCFLFFWYLLSMTVSWLGVGIFYISFYILVRGTIGGMLDGILFVIPQVIFLFVLLTNIVYGLGTKPHAGSLVYYMSCVFFSLLMLLTLFCTVFQVMHGWNDYSLLEKIGTIATTGSYLVAAVLHGETIVFATFIQYLLLLPTFIVVLQLYSWCNTHDFSWGTKGIESVHFVGAATGDERRRREQRQKEEESKREKEREERGRFRCVLLVMWVGTNVAIVALFYYLAMAQFQVPQDNRFTSNVTARYCAKMIFYVAGTFNCVRLAGSLLFLAQKWYERLRFPRNVPPPRSSPLLNTAV